MSDLAKLRAAAIAAHDAGKQSGATPTRAQQEVLDRLADNDGAILWWQLPRALWDDAADAVALGVILSEPDSDLYVHPLAVRDEEDGAYSMPEAPRG